MWIDDTTATPAAVGKSSKSWFLRHKILTAIAALFLVGAIGNAFGSDEVPATTATSDSRPTTSTSSTMNRPGVSGGPVWWLSRSA